MALADKVSDAWIAFARTGDPNTPKLPHWPRFNANGPAYDGLQQRQQSGERSDPRTAPGDVQRS